MEGSATVKMLLKFLVLSNERWMLICLTVSNVLIHPTTIRLPPTFFTENFGSVSWAIKILTDAIEVIKSNRISLFIITKRRKIWILLSISNKYTTPVQKYTKRLTFHQEVIYSPASHHCVSVIICYPVENNFSQ